MVRVVHIPVLMQVVEIFVLGDWELKGGLFENWCVVQIVDTCHIRTFFCFLSLYGLRDSVT